MSEIIPLRAVMNGKPVFTVPAKTVINFKSHFDKKLLCDGITFTAGSACAYSCSFCYVESMQLKQRKWFENHGVKYPDEGHFGVVIRTEKAAELARQQIMSKPAEFRQAKKVIYSSPKIDVAANMELIRETVAICKVILELTNWDIRLLSKSNLLPKIAKLLIDEAGMESKHIYERMIFGVSTGTLDNNLAKAFERGTPLVSKRIESLHWLQDHGFRTFGMICPSLPQTDYDKFAFEMATAIRAEKCEHIWAEIINVRGESFGRTYDALFASGYKKEAEQVCEVSANKEKREQYARDTFLGHTREPYFYGKLRFLQYVTKETRSWWESQAGYGAVIL